MPRIQNVLPMPKENKTGRRKDAEEFKNSTFFHQMRREGEGEERSGGSTGFIPSLVFTAAEDRLKQECSRALVPNIKKKIKNITQNNPFGEFNDYYIDQEKDFTPFQKTQMRITNEGIYNREINTVKWDVFKQQEVKAKEILEIKKKWKKYTYEDKKARFVDNVLQGRGRDKLSVCENKKIKEIVLTKTGKVKDSDRKLLNLRRYEFTNGNDEDKYFPKNSVIDKKYIDNHNIWAKRVNEILPQVQIMRKKNLANDRWLTNFFKKHFVINKVTRAYDAKKDLIDYKGKFGVTRYEAYLDIATDDDIELLDKKYGSGRKKTPRERLTREFISRYYEHSSCFQGHAYIYKILNSKTKDFLNRFAAIDRTAGNGFATESGQIVEKKTGHIVSTELQKEITFCDYEYMLGRELNNSRTEYTRIYDIFSKFEVVVVDGIPRGGMNKGELPAFLVKRGITPILNADNLCGQRCLALAESKNKDHKKNMLSRESTFKRDTDIICGKLGLFDKMSFTDFEKYATLYEKKVVILSRVFSVIYETEKKYKTEIYLYFDESIEHYHYINDINAATNDVSRNKKWCKICKKSFCFSSGQFGNHKCIPQACTYCKECFTTEDARRAHIQNKDKCACTKCNSMCHSEGCRIRHEKICRRKEVRCTKCTKFCHIDHLNQHICGEVHCKTCDVYHTEKDNHECYIKPLEKREGIEPLPERYFTFDFESDVTAAHIVNMVKVSELFSDITHTFDTIEEFSKFSLKQKNSTFLAHNLKGYDGWILHKYLIKNTNIRPSKLILAGQKIMYMKIKSIRFIDSLNHIASPLSKMPAMFGLSDLKKGYFPYKFNTAANRNYIGKMPAKSYFSPGEMGGEKDDKGMSAYDHFIEWYKSEKERYKQTGLLYDFNKELNEYCHSDVDILKRSLEIYVKNGIELTNINPLTCMTAASYAMKVFKTNFMKEKTISVLTKKMYEFIKNGFFGGRTEVFRLHTKLTQEQIDLGWELHYKDVVSLYPTVQFFDELPCGQGVWKEEPVYTDTKDYIKNNFGFHEVDILPPAFLHRPLLPAKGEKLMFDLTEKKKQVYPSAELEKALEIGYTITKIYKSLTFERSRDIFKGYVQTFLKIKSECSGVPEMYKGRVKDYIRDLKEHCGVELEEDKIIKNPGMKALAKLMLNSLWGKFGQRSDMRSNVYISNPGDWYRLLQKHLDGKVEIINEVDVDEHTMFVTYQELEIEKTSITGTNIGIAAMVTSQARLRLYAEMEKLGDLSCYCDTDSLKYIYKPGGYSVPSGPLLGQWENEFSDGDYGIEFLSLAPKAHGHITLHNKKSIKCKGVTLSKDNSAVVNLDSMRELIHGKKKEIETKKLMFIKNAKTGEMRTEMQTKILKHNPADFKRIINADFTTTAYGVRT